MFVCECVFVCMCVCVCACVRVCVCACVRVSHGASVLTISSYSSYIRVTDHVYAVSNIYFTVINFVCTQLYLCW